MILLPCRLAGSRPKLLTRPYVVEKREAGLERYGTDTDASLSRTVTSTYSPVPHESPSAPLSLLFVCACVCFDLQGDLNVFSVSPLVVDLCGLNRCSHKMIHSVLGNRQLKNENTHCEL